jgi:hypothetical protein
VATQHFVEDKAWGDVDLGDAAVAGLVSAAIPGLGNVAKAGIREEKLSSQLQKQSRRLLPSPLTLPIGRQRMRQLSLETLTRLKGLLQILGKLRSWLVPTSW